MKAYTDLVPRVLELAVSIQQIPAPTFAEAYRADFICRRFEEHGLRDVSTDRIGNVYARYPGAGKKTALVITAHTDTVFPQETDLRVKRQANRISGAGIGDNSLGVAALFGILWALEGRASRGGPSRLLPGDLWLVANTAEEGLGNLAGMRAVVDRFGEGVLAYLVLEGMALGQVYHRALGVSRYRITVSTGGGHSWVDYGSPSAVHELARLITELSAMPLPASPRTTMNVGMVQGGTSINTIAPHAHMELDLRSESEVMLRELVSRVAERVRDANRPGVSVDWELIGERPAGSLPVDHPLIRLVTREIAALGIQPVLSIGSTDANIPLSRGLPAVCLGITTGGGAHTVDEYIHTAPIAQGLQQLIAVIDAAFDLL